MLRTSIRISKPKITGSILCNMSRELYKVSMDHLFIKTKTQDEFEYAFEKIRASIGNGILAFKIRLK